MVLAGEHRERLRGERPQRRPRELHAQVAKAGIEDRVGDRHEQIALGLAHGIRPQQERTAGLMLPHPPRPFVQQRRQAGLHFVHVAGGMLVDDHDIRPQSLQPPVLLRFERLAHDAELLIDDAHEQDWQVAGEAVRPEAVLAELVRPEHIGRGAQRSLGAEDARCEPLEQDRVLIRDVHVSSQAM